MLSEFSVENFYSINDEIALKFNFPSNRAHSFKQNVIFEYNDPNKRCILNGGIIFGPNASGKSNILKALKYLKLFVDSSYKFDEYDDIMVNLEPFKFNKKKLTKFKIEVIFDDYIKNYDDYIKTYKESTITNETINEIIEKKSYIVNYELFLDSEKMTIENEQLSYREIMKTKVGKTTTLFKRTNDEIIDNASGINEIRRKVEMDNITYKSLLSLIINDINRKYFKEEVENFEYRLIKKFYMDFFRNIYFSRDNVSENFVRELNENEKYRKYILKNLRKFDFAIKDFEIEDITSDVINTLISEETSDDFKKFIEHSLKANRRYRTSAIHYVNKEKYEIPLTSESDGTQKFLNQSYSMYEALLKDGLFVVDEFESAYHHKIQEGIVNNFINQNGKAQFLIVSHNSLLLNKELFAKEQIIFTEKNRRKESTKIKYLSDFEDITYNNHNWVNLYYDGRFGATPEVIF